MQLFAEKCCEKVRIFIQNNDMEAVAGTILFALGFKSKLSGTKYLHAALVEMQKIEECCLRRDLYPKIAEKFNTNSSCVERSIRHSINDCLIAGTLLRMNDLLGVPVVNGKYPPTNSELISSLSAWIRLERTACEHRHNYRQDTVVFV